LAAYNRKKTPVLRKQKSIKKNKIQLAKKKIKTKITVIVDNLEVKADQD
jgi:hypothetical protein